MAKRPKTAELNTDDKVRDTERRMTSMALPLAVHARLDELAKAGEDVNTSRAEIVAMLVSETELDPADLQRRLIAYRRLTVGDLLGDSDDGSVVVPLHGPGRRKGGTTAQAPAR